MSVRRWRTPLGEPRVSTSAKYGEITGAAAPVGPVGMKSEMPAPKLMLPLLLAKNCVYGVPKKLSVKPRSDGPAEAVVVASTGEADAWLVAAVGHDDDAADPAADHVGVVLARG